MSTETTLVVRSVIELMKSMYEVQIADLSQKLKNIDYLNIDSLVKKIEKDYPKLNPQTDYGKIVKLIEEILRD